MSSSDKVNADISMFIVELPLSTACNCEERSAVRFLRAKNVTSIKIQLQVVGCVGIFPYFFFWWAKRCEKKIIPGKCCVGSSGNTVKILLLSDEANADISMFIIELPLSTAANCEVWNVIWFLHVRKVMPIEIHCPLSAVFRATYILSSRHGWQLTMNFDGPNLFCE